MNPTLLRALAELGLDRGRLRIALGKPLRGQLPWVPGCRPCVDGNRRF
jgi:hypothetical protein